MYEDVQAVERSGIGATSYRKEMIRNVPVAAMALAVVLSGNYSTNISYCLCDAQNFHYS